ASGVATGSLSSTGTGAKTVTAVAGGVVLTQKPVVTVGPGAAAGLAFTVQPTNTATGAPISPAVRVEIRDQFGNAVTDATHGVTVALGTNPAGGTLGGTTTVPAVSGVATFSTLTVDNVGAGYTLAATAGGLSGATSDAFNVTTVPPSASQSTLVAAPPAITASTGASSSTISVTAKDAGGNPLSGMTVTLSATGSGNTLTQPAGVTDVSGVATGSLSSTVAEGKTVSATAGGTPLIQTAAVTVTSGPPPGISHTLLTAGKDTTNGKLFTSGVIAPAPNTLVTIALLSYRSSGATSPTVSGGGMASWTVVASVDFDDLALPRRRLTIYRALSATPGSGPLSFNFAATQSNASWVVSQWDGVETSGVNGAGAIGQTGSNRADAATSLSVALAGLGDPNNVTLGAFGVNHNILAITPGSGFTEISEQPVNEGTKGDLQTEWAVNRSTVTASWPTLRAGALGVEIKAKIGP
ncbi:MAG: Ig-like domain-containing protein, partial [Gemmatimonadales bacterium]